MSGVTHQEREFLEVQHAVTVLINLLQDLLGDTIRYLRRVRGEHALNLVLRDLARAVIVEDLEDDGEVLVRQQRLLRDARQQELAELNLATAADVNDVEHLVDVFAIDGVTEVDAEGLRHLTFGQVPVVVLVDLIEEARQRLHHHQYPNHPHQHYWRTS